MTLRQSLKAMHYREARAGKWTKPVGFHLFTFEEDREEWTNWFLPGNSEQPARYDAKKIDHRKENSGTYLQQLKDFEAYTRINISVSARAEFHGLGLDL